jgi:tRNA(Arg) A34 adenosine deaminase TadA
MERRQGSGITARRGLLLGGLAIVGASAAPATGRPLAAAGDAGDIAQPEVADPAHFMARAQAMRALAIETGDQAYGAVVVRDGRIVGQAPSRVVVNRDPTAHAETEAIRDAARRLGTADLSGCRLYSTSRACQMCETAAYWAQIDALVHGAAMESAGRPQYRRC